MGDKINPDHYKKNGIEVIDFIDSVLSKDLDAYYIGNVLKYCSRWKNKNGIEDLKKAQWYLNRLINTLNKQDAHKHIVQSSEEKTYSQGKV